ncbi:Cytoskeleton-associated protein 5 [Armadillidium vulgare]|nr:Cytoskeleton-associated protein 5 [Armadillidium vulgare]
MNDVYDDGEEETSRTSTQDKDSRVNIADQITPELISELGDKNWKVRMEALGKISTMLTDAKLITGDIGELPDALCARLNDTNKNIAAEALKITSQLGIALGVQGKQHVRIIIPGLFGSLGDAKKSMRDQALIALNDWVDHLNSVKDVIDGEMCIDALKSGSPFLKIELINWLSKKLREAPPRSLNKEELNGCVTYIYSGMEDRNVEIRKASNEAIFPFMLHLGYDGMVKHAGKVKPSSKNTVMQALEKAKPNLPARPSSTQGSSVNKSKSTSAVGGRQASAERGDTSASSVSSGGASAKGIKKGIASRTVTKGSASSRKEEEVDTSPLLQVNNMKQQRQTEEQRMRTLRWDFATPRPEFVSQLKDQMSNAGLNRQLLTNMFHQDFKFHIKAIDALVEDLYDNVESCTCNLDLVLRWLTIRFFDTNPSVILKAMDYLSNVFTLLLENDYHLTDYEAYSFLPFLIMKFGDPKDAIRGPTKNIIKLICNIYPASKVSPYILDGLKSKNARQRAECLETMGSLIEDYGMTVCQPSPPVALKEVAKQIADRDSSVRNAALNCLLQVYLRQGEKVYKLIGQISDKDHSLLEERIKRAAKSKPVIKMPAVVEQPSNPSTVRGGAGSAIGRPNRVIPTPAAQPSPLIRDGRIPQAASATGYESRDLRKKVNYYHPHKYYGSCDELDERYLCDKSLSHFTYNKLGTRFSSMCNLQSKKIKPYRKKSEECDSRYLRKNKNDNSNRQIVDVKDQQSEDSAVLPQLRIPKRETASFERAKRFSRSLSHILGEAFEQEESLRNSGDRKDFAKLGHPKTSLSRMATSPQLSGFGQRPLSGEIGNRNSRFQIDFDFIEKLIEGDGPLTETSKKYKLEEIPDMDSVLEYEAPATLPTSSLARPGFTSAMRANVVNANIDLEMLHNQYGYISVATPDVNTVITALSQLDEVIESDEKRSLLSPHIDQLLIVARFQYKHVLNTKMSDETINKEECIRIYRSLTSCLMSIFNNKDLGTKASRDVLRDIIHVIINILLDSKLSSLEDGPRLAYPSNTWAERPSSTPIRTIKTVLHTLVKEYGSDILKYLSQVPNIQGSELQKYVIKDLNLIINGLS